MTPAGNWTFLLGMSNVLAKEKRQQVLALGRLGWSLRRIERATGVRRETVSSYLKAAGVVVRGRGRPRGRPRPNRKTGHFFGGVHRLVDGTVGQHGHG